MTRSTTKSSAAKSLATKTTPEKSAVVQASEAISETAWDRFWFTPISSRPLAWLRIATGLLLLLFLGDWWGKSVDWFAADGYLSPENTRLLWIEQNASPYAYSPLMHWESANALRSFQLGALMVAMLFTLGFATRVTGWLAFAALLAYVHRAPWLAGAGESWLAMLLLYLNLAPCGAWHSLDAWFFKGLAPKSWLANLSLRLMQLHTLAFVVVGAGTLLAAKSHPHVIDWSAFLISTLATGVGISTWVLGIKFSHADD